MFSRRTDIATGSEQFDARAHMSPGVFRQVREKTTLGFFTGTVPLDKPAGKQGPKDLPLLSPATSTAVVKEVHIQIILSGDRREYRREVHDDHLGLIAVFFAEAYKHIHIGADDLPVLDIEKGNHRRIRGNAQRSVGPGQLVQIRHHPL